MTDGHGLVCANLNEWAQMLRRGGSMPCGLDAPLHSRQLQMIPEWLSCRWTLQFRTKISQQDSSICSINDHGCKDGEGGDFNTLAANSKLCSRQEAALESDQTVLLLKYNLVNLCPIFFIVTLYFINHGSQTLVQNFNFSFPFY